MESFELYICIVYFIFFVALPLFLLYVSWTSIIVDFILSFIFLLIFLFSIISIIGRGGGEYFFEISAFVISLIILIRFFMEWYSSLSNTRQPLNKLVSFTFRLLPVASFIIIYNVLKSWASYDVIDDPIYITYYIVMGYAWISIGLMLLFIFLDISWRIDAINNNNHATAIAISGGFIALTAIYAGANTGDGPGWWCVVYAGGLGVAALISFTQLVDSFTNVLERVTVERNTACGIRLCFYWLAGGLLLARACGGDWTSFSMTDIEFEDKWPIIPLTLLMIIIERYYIFREKSENHSGKNNVFSSVICGIVFIAFATTSLILLPPLPVNPIYLEKAAIYRRTATINRNAPALMTAARDSKNLEVLDALINEGVDINKKDYDGWTALMTAARYNVNAEVTNALIEAGADVNAKNNDGWTALMLAVRYNENFEVINALIKAGADVNARDPIEWITAEFKYGGGTMKYPAGTVLMIAARYSENSIVTDALIKAGANVNARLAHGDTALTYAVEHNKNPEIAISLIKAGADVNAKNTSFNTALMLAVQNNVNSEVTNALINAGADVNAKSFYGWTPLMSAAKNSENPEIISILLKNGANVQARDNDGKSAIDRIWKNEKLKNTYAVRELREANFRHEVTKALINDGANINAKNSDGWTALMTVAQYDDNSEKLGALINAGADVNAKTGSGWTALMIAARYNENSEVTSALINAGADVNVKDKNGWTALTMAVQYKVNAEVTNALINAGADVNVKISIGWTVLMIAARHNVNSEVANALINAGADVNAKTGSGWTPLMFAAQLNSNPEALNALINAGADVNAERYGETALMTAARYNVNSEVTNALIKAGANVNAKNKDNFTALMIAALYNKNPEIISILLRNGADVKAKDKYGKRAIDYAKRNEKLKNTDALRELEKAVK